MTDTAQLPVIIDAYLTARRHDDVDSALATFAADAAVTDEDKTHRGPVDIREWLATAATEYTYTIELTGTRRVDDDHWIATHHLEGDFPGGVVDLHFDFRVSNGKIQQLTIAP